MSFSAFENKDLGFTTKQLHAGFDPAEHHLSKAVPIYQTAAFELVDMERCVKITSYETPGFSYARSANPTNDVLQKRMAALEGGSAALAMASGMAAISNVFLNLTKSGDEIVASNTLYGGSLTLLTDLLPQYGVKGVFVEDDADPSSYEAAITENTKAIFVESLGNPCINIIDIEKIAEIAHAHGIPLIVDNTFATPYLLRPFEFGADIVVYSATKYLGGHGTVIGGISVEKGGFDWWNGNFPQMEAFYEEYKGVIDEDDLRQNLFTRRLRIVFLTDLGSHMAPQTAFYILQGIETLSLRMERHVQNAKKIATFLEGHSSVNEVNYPGLSHNVFHELSKKYYSVGPGAMLSFRVKGGLEGARKVLENVRLIDYMVNVGDAKSLIVHPATSIHYGKSPEIQEAAGVYLDTLRLSVGIEDIEDIIADLDQALNLI